MTLFALFGGMGEFDDWAEPIHRLLVEAGAGDGSVAILPMMIRDEYLAREDLPLYERLGARVSVVPVRDRPDAQTVANVDALSSCSLIFMHGGCSAWLADTLRDTPVWRDVCAAIRRGVSFAATSGGIMCLGTRVPRLDEDYKFSEWADGLGLLRAAIGSHWDSERFRPTTRDPFEHIPSEQLVLAVDEHTAMIGDGTSWSAAGKGAVHVIQHGGEEAYRDGERFEARLR